MINRCLDRRNRMKNSIAIIPILLLLFHPVLSFSSSSDQLFFSSQLDTIPVVNPTTPATFPISPPPPPPITPTINPTTPPTTMNPTTPVSSSWCIASPNASPTALQVAIDYACGYGAADCSAIQPGSSCYDPNTLRDHASYAFNSYYHKQPSPISCVFGGAAQLTTTDPSSGNCHFPSSSTTTTSITSPPPPSIIISSPVNPTPTLTPVTNTPGGQTVYGVAEPTGLPNSAISVSTLYLLLTTCFMVSLFTINYL